nr:hypothetical protein [Parabacteroides goldsteinii]
MEGYILIVLQILITGLIIWRRKQDSKEPSGCLAAGVIFMIVFALTTALFSLGHLIINEGLFANIFAESRGSLAAASPMEWLIYLSDNDAGICHRLLFGWLCCHRPSPQILQTDMENTGNNPAVSRHGIGNIGCGIWVCLYYLHEVCLTHV